MSDDNAHTPARLSVSAAVFGIALITAIVFASAFAHPPQPGEARHTPPTTHPDHDAGHDKPGHDGDAHTDDHADEPQYNLGGLWSPRLGLAGLAEIATLATGPEGKIVAQSVGWTGSELVVIDVSPLEKQKGGTELLLISVDHAGGDINPEFATAIQQHVDGLLSAKKVLIITPIPGPAQRPEDEFPYDWTFLQSDDHVEILDWAYIEAEEDLPGKPHTGYLRAWLKQAGVGVDGLSKKPIKELLLDANLLIKRSLRARHYWSAATRSPYKVIPAMPHGVTIGTSVGGELRPTPSPIPLLLHRAMGVHADALIAEAAASEDPMLRANAARTIGALADQTTDPLGKLTPLAEDKDARVRYEALAATRSTPGRRAAGVAQLVENMPMDGPIKTLFDATMAQLLTYGEPVQADSKADRVWRMPLAEAMSLERGLIVSKVLLERPDLPDDQVDGVLGQYAEAIDKPKLEALIDLLAGMNPRRLRDREPLLRLMVGWDKAELAGKAGRLTAIATSDATAPLRSAAAGALARSLASHLAVVERVGMKPALFEALAWLDPSQISSEWTQFVIESALSADPAAQESRVAALDAIKHLPPAALTADTVSRVLGLARTADSIDLRFAAIRAVNDLPDAVKPADIDDLELTRLTLKAVPGLKYDLEQLTVAAGRPVELTLINPDNMDHNLVITKPGQGQAVGVLAASLTAAEDYVPDSPDVLHAMPLVKPGRAYTLRFFAPASPGDYDYVCTFPGHPQSMKGVLKVTEP